MAIHCARHLNVYKTQDSKKGIRQYTKSVWICFLSSTYYNIAFKLSCIPFE